MVKPRTSPISPVGSEFGRHIRRLRKGRGMTQEVLSERSGLSSDTIRRLERADFSPSLETLTKVIGGLRIDFSTLFVAFEGHEIGTDRELLAMTRSLTPDELAKALRVLALLADLLAAVAADGDERG
jgi:transcriptional regulator with XRE-family HTH domain